MITSNAVANRAKARQMAAYVLAQTKDQEMLIDFVYFLAAMLAVAKTDIETMIINTAAFMCSAAAMVGVENAVGLFNKFTKDGLDELTEIMREDIERMQQKMNEILQERKTNENL